MDKIIKYIDCDGVILDTVTGLFDEYDRLNNEGANLGRVTYLQQLNWREWLRQAPIINDSITILKEHDPKESVILTKIHSLNEGLAKIEYFRELGIKNNIVLVPYELSKPQVVQASESILVDDYLKNLDDWSKANGISFFFNQFGKNENIYNGEIIPNKDYPLITSLDSIFSEEINEYCKKLYLKK